MNRKIIIGAVLITLAQGLFADTLQLRSDHPQTYVVVKGDTLWDISAKFLTDPWKWWDIWEKNPQIDNPDLIFPGDIITLIYVDGKPRLVVNRGKQAQSVGKLSPTIRDIEIEKAIHVIPLDSIRQFLSKPKIVGPEQLEQAPYIINLSDGRIIGGAGDKIYVRSIEQGSMLGYNVFRPGETYRDAETDEILGYEAMFVAETQLERTGDPATLLLTRTDRETLVGDRLLSLDSEQVSFQFIPRKPGEDVRGHIIAVVDGVSQIGQYDVVVIDRGSEDGLEKGHMLGIFQSGRVVRDTVKGMTGETVTLPEQRSGRLMIFQTFDRLSYGLVVNANNALHVNDAVRGY